MAKNKMKSAVMDKYECATIVFEPQAYLKMRTLVARCKDEVAWHGLVEKLDENKFFVTDILCFPQYVCGGSTTTDDAEYWKWVFKYPNDTPLLMHGHSHVNFSAFRSGRDEAFQKPHIASLKEDGFYIYLITNKKGDYNIRLVNKKINKVWESEKDPILIEIYGMDEFLNDALSMVKPLIEMPHHNGKMVSVCSEFEHSPDSGSPEYDDDWEHWEEYTNNDPFARNEL